MMRSVGTGRMAYLDRAGCAEVAPPGLGRCVPDEDDEAPAGFGVHRRQRDPLTGSAAEVPQLAQARVEQAVYGGVQQRQDAPLATG
jgi:hypothetical protein